MRCFVDVAGAVNVGVNVDVVVPATVDGCLFSKQRKSPASAFPLRICSLRNRELSVKIDRDQAEMPFLNRGCTMTGTDLRLNIS